MQFDLDSASFQAVLVVSVCREIVMSRTIPARGNLQSLSGMRLCRFPVDSELFPKLVRPSLCPKY